MPALVIAHRGASADAPENTMPAFELACAQGADMIELDVQRSADGQLVVFHDATTARWNGRRDPVAALTLEALRRVDVGGSRIPTLAEACTLARERGIQLNVELKQFDIAADVVALVRALQVDDLVLVSCFRPGPLRIVAELAPHVRRGYLMGINALHPVVRAREAWPLVALKRARVHAWHPFFQLPLLEATIPLVRRAGYQVYTWTVNDAAAMRRMLALGVDGIITDRPALLRSLLA